MRTIFFQIFFSIFFFFFFFFQEGSGACQHPNRGGNFFFIFFFFFEPGLKLDEKSTENGLEGQKCSVGGLFWGWLPPP